MVMLTIKINVNNTNSSVNNKQLWAVFASSFIIYECFILNAKLKQKHILLLILLISY